VGHDSDVADAVQGYRGALGLVDGRHLGYHRPRSGLSA
jgi:hypothetical protein